MKRRLHKLDLCVLELVWLTKLILEYLCVDIFRVPLKVIYMCQCEFYIYSIAALLMWETRRKDFSVMMSHHVVSVSLISGSYIVRYFFFYLLVTFEQ